MRLCQWLHSRGHRFREKPLSAEKCASRVEYCIFFWLKRTFVLLLSLFQDLASSFLLWGNTIETPVDLPSFICLFQGLVTLDSFHNILGVWSFEIIFSNIEVEPPQEIISNHPHRDFVTPAWANAFRMHSKQRKWSNQREWANDYSCKRIFCVFWGHLMNRLKFLVTVWVEHTQIVEKFLLWYVVQQTSRKMIRSLTHGGLDWRHVLHLSSAFPCLVDFLLLFQNYRLVILSARKASTLQK